MEPRQDFRYYKIDLEAATLASVNYKTGQVTVGLDDGETRFTKTFESPHPNFVRLAERLKQHVFNLMRFEESAREDIEWRGVKWQNRDSDGESITLSYTYKGIDGTVAGCSIPKMVLDTTSYNRVGDLREVLADLDCEAKEAWGGKSAQMSLDFTAKQMRKAVETDPKESDVDQFEQQDNENHDDLPPLHVNTNGGAVPEFDDEGNPVIITDEADDSFEQKDQAQEDQGVGKSGKPKKPKKGTMAVVTDEAAA